MRASPVEAPEVHAVARRHAGAAALLSATAAVHGALTPEHFREGALFGWAFLVMTALQLGLAVALVARPGRRAEGLARQSLVLLVALYLLARVVPVPGQTEPETASLLGGLTVAVEVAAWVALARLPRSRPPRLRPVATGLTAASAVVIALLLVTGSLRYSPWSLAREFQGGPPALLWQDHGTGFTPDNPHVVLYVTDHLVLFGPLLTLDLVAALAIEVGIGAARSRRALLAGRRARRQLYWIPAFITAPACCGAPLLGIVGPTVFAALLAWGWIPLAAAVVIGACSLSYAGTVDARSGTGHTTGVLDAARAPPAQGVRAS